MNEQLYAILAGTAQRCKNCTLVIAHAECGYCTDSRIGRLVVLERVALALEYAEVSLEHRLTAGGSPEDEELGGRLEKLWDRLDAAGRVRVKRMSSLVNRIARKARDAK